MNLVRLLPLLLALAVSAALAQPDEARNGTFSFVLENDLFYDSDRHYTNGVRFAWVPDRRQPVPQWARRSAELMPWFPRGATIRHGYAFGQSMFTPRDITLRNPPAGERPYAGWLYGSVGLGVETDHVVDQFGFTLGVVGPASLAEETQKFVHRRVDANRPEGWRHQLRNEPGLILSWKRSWREVHSARALGNEWDFGTHVGTALGNVFTDAKTGLMLRYGPDLPRDYGPPRIEPSLPGASDFHPAAGFRWYVFAGLEGRAVARNIFLDGNSFRSGSSVDKHNFVGDLQFGLVVDWKELRLSYTHVARSREFKSQRDSDVFGAFTVLLRL